MLAFSLQGKAGLVMVVSHLGFGLVRPGPQPGGHLDDRSLRRSRDQGPWGSASSAPAPAPRRAAPTLIAIAERTRSASARPML